MKLSLLLFLPFLIASCSFRPDYSVHYKSTTPQSDLTVIYDQRIPDSMGDEENVFVEMSDGVRHQIDQNGRFSDNLHVDISEDTAWYRFYLKNQDALPGHLEYRDVDGDGELDRVWKSKNEDPARATLHRYAVTAYLRKKDGNVFRRNRDFGFDTGPNRDLFGSKVSLESRQSLLGKKVHWKPMKRV